ncbi:hypothetical protein [Paraherbaspirillum soli]|uniref:Uncharacterized protein n=1 Tax=Paraherbaspirillum soli TaxID=631222 RepID=A0ABW0MDE6_9BURK
MMCIETTSLFFLRTIRNACALFFLLTTFVHAEIITFTCKGAEVKIDVPKYFELARASEDSCTFWRNREENPDYSGYYFEGIVSLSAVGDKKPRRFVSTSYERDDTWNKLLSKKTILVQDGKEKFLRIDQGNFRSKFIRMISPMEMEENIERITRIEGKVFSKGVWVEVGLALPYKTLTKQQAIDMIKSVEVVRGFDAETK